jgi:hypothetical protein
MSIFKTKYRVDLERHDYFYVYRKKWYWLDWVYFGMFDSLETAKSCIAREKANPVWEE